MDNALWTFPCIAVFFCVNTERSFQVDSKHRLPSFVAEIGGFLPKGHYAMINECSEEGFEQTWPKVAEPETKNQQAARFGF